MYADNKSIHYKCNARKWFTSNEIRRLEKINENTVHNTECLSRQLIYSVQISQRKGEKITGPAILFPPCRRHQHRPEQDQQFVKRSRPTADIIPTKDGRHTRDESS